MNVVRTVQTDGERHGGVHSVKSASSATETPMATRKSTSFLDVVCRVLYSGALAGKAITAACVPTGERT